MLAPRLHPLLLTEAVMTEAASEPVLCRGLWRNARLACCAARLAGLNTLLLLLHQVLPHLFTQLRTLLSLTLLRLQRPQLALFRACESAPLCSLLQSLLQLLCAQVGAFLTLLRALLSLTLLRLQALQALAL
jgi:hypothetical protein